MNTEELKLYVSLLKNLSVLPLPNACINEMSLVLEALLGTLITIHPALSEQSQRPFPAHCGSA